MTSSVWKYLEVGRENYNVKTGTCARPSFAATEAVQTDSGYTCKIDMNKSVRGRFGLGLLIDWVMLTPKTCNKTCNKTLIVIVIAFYLNTYASSSFWLRSSRI